ncbi:MAG TPA: glycine cleavage system aminomethyltransferase GcvT [Planctomycetales bacterium]|jgi:aminomethyltransferase|nr:glycine cleavage system aminomethyltransferase GcvT [Planctomycetales bacterium]
MGLRTPLYDWHVAHGARMVDFGGWDMPVQYTTIIDEHTAVRTGAGLFDVSHMGRLSFAGPDSFALIQHVFTNDAATMKDGQVRYGLICNESGGVRDDVLVYRWPYGYAMVVNAGNREKIISWLAEHKGTRNVEVSDRTTETCMAAVQGPKAVEMCHDLTAVDPAQLAYYHAAPSTYQGKPCVISRTGYTGEDGVEIIVAAAQGAGLFDELAARGAKPCGLGARDTLRLEAAMPLYGHELTEYIDPLQAGLGWAVKLNKGDFIGRDALLRLQQDKTEPVRVGLMLDGKRVAREGATIKVASVLTGINGCVTSGTFSPTLQKPIAMAYVDLPYAAVGTALPVDVRGKYEAARVVGLPFYRRPKT